MANTRLSKCLVCHQTIGRYQRQCENCLKMEAYNCPSPRYDDIQPEVCKFTRWEDQIDFDLYRCAQFSLIKRKELIA